MYLCLQLVNIKVIQLCRPNKNSIQYIVYSSCNLLLLIQNVEHFTVFFMAVHQRCSISITFRIHIPFKRYSQSILSCMVAVAGLPTPFIAMHWYIPAECLVCAWNRKIGRLSKSCISSPYRYNKFLLQGLQSFHVSHITFQPFVIFTQSFYLTESSDITDTNNFCISKRCYVSCFAQL